MKEITLNEQQAGTLIAILTEELEKGRANFLVSNKYITVVEQIMIKLLEE